jgi:hypothetical protein
VRLSGHDRGDVLLKGARSIGTVRSDKSLNIIERDSRQLSDIAPQPITAGQARRAQRRQSSEEGMLAIIVVGVEQMRVE